ncbi:MAG: hypothetical protein MUF15_07725, partial [Acidobacteria bacterium]|nr:hypothetical protein [Acidobacteriota bacterium]
MFISVNISPGIDLISQFNEFKLKTGPFAVQTTADQPFVYHATLDIDKNGYDEIILSRGGSIANINEFMVFHPSEKKKVPENLESIKVPDNYEFLDAIYNKKSNTYRFKF